MKLKLFIALTIVSFLFSCGNSDDTEQKELELKEKELALKEKELSQNESKTQKQNDTVVALTNVKPTGINELSNLENLIGNWFVPHDATTKIKFARDGSFEFSDFNSSLDKEELLTGTYKLENGTLTLLYDDRPKQNFRFYKGTNGDENYYIKKGEYYFVKGENGN